MWSAHRTNMYENMMALWNVKSAGTYVVHRACSDSSSWRQCKGKHAIFLRDFLVSSMKFNVFDDATDATGEDRTKPKPLSELSSTADIDLFFWPHWNEQMAPFDNSAGSKGTLKTFKKQPVLQNMDLLAENQSRAGSDMCVAKMPTGGHVQLNHMTKTSAASQTNPNQTLCRYICSTHTIIMG